jgi:hypothetical protein
MTRLAYAELLILDVLSTATGLSPGGQRTSTGEGDVNVTNRPLTNYNLNADAMPSRKAAMKEVLTRGSGNT